MENEINNLIDHTHFKTFNHIYAHVKAHFPNVTPFEVDEIIKHRKHDRLIMKKKLLPYMIKIYSPVLNTWFMDLMDNNELGVPRYWYIFIGTNNRYGVAYPIERKSWAEVKPILEQFNNEYHPVKLTSDMESAFCCKDAIAFYKKHDIKFHSIPDKNHSALGIIDRFIRTLRDMNRPMDGEEKQSWDDTFKTIDPDKMNEILPIYNNTYHKGIGMAPAEMRDNPELEKRYIAYCQEKAQQQKEELEDFEIPIGTYVRYKINPPDPKSPKKRYQYTNESFKVIGRKGLFYKLLAENGSVITKPRYKLILADAQKYKLSKIQPEKDNLKFANGKFVRIYTDNPFVNKKDMKDDAYSDHSYKIVQRDGNSYILQAKDGNMFTMKGKLLTPANILQHPHAETIPD